MGSKWRFGCGKEIIVHIPRGFAFLAVLTECGATAYDGNINQCDVCQIKHPYSAVRDEESDMDWFERNSFEEE